MAKTKDTFIAGILPLPPKKMGRPTPRACDMGKARELVLRGASVREIAATLNVSHGTAQRAVNAVRALLSGPEDSTRKKNRVARNLRA